MALPKIDSAIFTTTLPSNGNKIKYRPFLVKEEKILMTAQESKDEDGILDAVRQLLTNCVVSPKEFDVDSLPMFDIEWLFVKLRAVSVNNVIELKYKDREDKQSYEFSLDLNELEMTSNPEHTNVIQLTDDGIGITLKYPNINMIKEMELKEIADAEPTAIQSLEIIKKCIDTIFDEEQVYDQFSEKELDVFLGDMNHKMLEKIQVFFDTMPKLSHEFKYINKEGNNRSIKLEGMADFFTSG